MHVRDTALTLLNQCLPPHAPPIRQREVEFLCRRRDSVMYRVDRPTGKAAFGLLLKIPAGGARAARWDPRNEIKRLLALKEAGPQDPGRFAYVQPITSSTAPPMLVLSYFLSKSLRELLELAATDIRYIEPAIQASRRAGEWLGCAYRISPRSDPFRHGDYVHDNILVAESGMICVLDPEPINTDPYGDFCRFAEYALIFANRSKRTRDIFIRSFVCFCEGVAAEYADTNTIAQAYLKYVQDKSAYLEQTARNRFRQGVRHPRALLHWNDQRLLARYWRAWLQNIPEKPNALWPFIASSDARKTSRL